LLHPHRKSNNNQGPGLQRITSPVGYIRLATLY
jgi:hypothetical protein